MTFSRSIYPILLFCFLMTLLTSLTACLGAGNNLLHKEPELIGLTAKPTMKAIDAQYVEEVVAKIEKVGSFLFPDEGHNKSYGNPRLSISIYSDGSIREIKVVKSSGNQALDSKTMGIVARAAPFAPFPKEVRKERDVLELIRTFSYHKEEFTSY